LRGVRVLANYGRPIPKLRPCLRRARLGAATPTIPLALGGGLKTAHVALPKLRLRLPHVSSRSHRVAASIRPPRLLVEDNGASHPLRESGGGLGMVSFMAERVLRGNDKVRHVTIKYLLMTVSYRKIGQFEYN
jgi:hypothetical protein